MLNVPVLYVRGNHDAQYRNAEYNGCVNLHGRIVSCAGLRFAGFEGSQYYSYQACQHTEGQMRRAFEGMRVRALVTGAPDVLVTHAPPRGCHDAEDLCHRGFETFRAAIDAWRPTYLLHGHMHAYAGPQASTELDGTTVVNMYPFREITVPLTMRREGCKTLLGRIPHSFGRS